MVPLHIEDAGGALAVAFQRQAPGGMADAGGIFSACRCQLGRHEPAGIGGTGENAIRLTQKEPSDPVFAGAECQTPACGKVEETRVAPDLGQYRSEAVAAEPLLEHPEGICCRGNADDDQAARIEAEAGETGAVGKSGLARGGGFDDPQDRTIVLDGETGEDGDGEAGHGGGVTALRAAQLVESGTAKTAGKHAIETGDSEGKEGPGATRRKRGRGAGLQWRRVRTRAGFFARYASDPPLQLGDPALQAGKAAPCHENARAHGFQTRR